MIDSITTPSLAIQNTHFTPVPHSSCYSLMKGALEIAAFASSVFGSFYLASKNPGIWWMGVIAVNAINLSFLPQFLRYGNLKAAKAAIVVNLVGLSCLTLGGIAQVSFALTRQMVNSASPLQLSNFLFSSFFLTGVLGYGIPLFHRALKTAHRLLSSGEADKGIHALQQQFQQPPSIHTPLSQRGHSLESMVLQAALFCPDLILKLHAAEFNIPDYAFSMAAAASAQITINQFDQIITGIELLADNLAAAQVAIEPDMQEKKINLIKGAFRLLAPSDLTLAIGSFLTRGANLIPHVFSDDQFIKFFEDDVLLEGTNQIIQTFLNQTQEWKNLADRHHQLSLEMTQLEQDISTSSMAQDISDKKNDIDQQYEKHNGEYCDLRKEVEQVYAQARIWQKLAPLWKNASDLPFDQSSDLIITLNDQVLFTDIENLYRSLIGTGTGGNRSLHDLMQSITNKRASLFDEDEEEEAVTSVMFLAGYKGFVQRDFEDMRNWLDIDSFHDLEGEMASIGLGGVAELYQKDILSTKDRLSKTEICSRLQAYIEKASNTLHKKSIQPIGQADPNSVVSGTSNKVMSAIYYAISTAALLTPVFINPLGALAGFGCGLCFFILKRFHVPGVQTANNLGDQFLSSHFLNRLFRKYVLSSVFTRGAENRQETAYFTEGDYSKRLRMINLKIAISRLLLNHSIVSFARGAVVAQEIVGSF